MSRRLQDIAFRELLPDAIASDPAVSAVSSAIDGPLRGVTLGIPNLLLWARLDPAPGRLSPVMQRLTDAAGGLPPLSEAELELLAWQFHVDFRETAKTTKQLAEMVRQSIPWHRIKGTPASIKAALALFGISASIEEDGKGDNWATYQLGLSGVTDLDTVSTAVRVANEMAPVRCRLFRVYNEHFDMRPIVLSEGPILGEGWLSYYSGVSVPGGEGGDDVLASLGATHRVLSPPSTLRASFGLFERHAMLARRVIAFTLSVSQLSEKYQQNLPFLFTDMTTCIAFREHPSQTFSAQRFAKSQAILSEAWDALGGTNYRLGVPQAVVFDNPMVVGLSRLSDHDCRFGTARLDEMSDVSSCFGTGERQRPVSGFSNLSANIRLTSEHRHAQTCWPHEIWPHTRWVSRVSYANIKTEEVSA